MLLLFFLFKAPLQEAIMTAFNARSDKGGAPAAMDVEEDSGKNEKEEEEEEEPTEKPTKGKRGSMAKKQTPAKGKGKKAAAEEEEEEEEGEKIAPLTAKNLEKQVRAYLEQPSALACRTGDGRSLLVPCNGAGLEHGARRHVGRVAGGDH
jgi:hypothetical protein